MVERARDVLWDELVKVCKADAAEMTKSERGRFNKALKELKEVGATPEDIRARAGRWRLKYPELDLTPTALAAQWSTLKGAGASTRKGDGWEAEASLRKGVGHPSGSPAPSHVDHDDENKEANLRRLREAMGGIGKMPSDYAGQTSDGSGATGLADIHGS